MNYFYIRLFAIILSFVIVTASDSNQQQVTEATRPNGQGKEIISGIDIYYDVMAPTESNITFSTNSHNNDIENKKETSPTEFEQKGDSTNKSHQSDKDSEKVGDNTETTIPPIVKPGNEQSENLETTKKQNEENDVNSDNYSQDSTTSTTKPTIPTEPVTNTTKPGTEQSKPTESTIKQDDEREDIETLPTEPIVEDVTEPVTMPTQPVTNPTISTPIDPSKPKECTTHSMFLVSTEPNMQYPLYQYVTDIYRCENCSYSYSDIHIAKLNLSNCDILAEETRIVELVNQLRRDNGLYELVDDSAWKTWSQTRAKELSVLYGHNRPDGNSWCHTIGTEITFGENVAAGESSGEEFYNAFLNSPSHKSLMLDCQATKIAVSIYIDDTGTPYCAMVVSG